MLTTTGNFLPCWKTCKAWKKCHLSNSPERVDFFCLASNFSFSLAKKEGPRQVVCQKNHKIYFKQACNCPRQAQFESCMSMMWINTKSELPLTPDTHFIRTIMQFLSTYDRLGDVRWKLCVTDTSGKKHWSSADCFQVFKSSVCVRWYSLQLPPLSRLKTLQVFAFVPIFFNRNWKPHINRSVPC